ncbi:MAG: hypothetical protein Q7S79_01945, partial [bacterium]|nr:hypothetical protein [bacterium]
MARQEFGQYLTPSNFLRGVTAAALLTAATPRGAEAQAWPVWTGPYPIELEGGRVLDVSSPDRSRDVVAELWDMADPCTLTLVTVRPGQGSVFINGPVAGNARVVGNETLLSTRVNEMRANLLKQKPELANCGPDALKIVNGPTAPRPAWFDQVKNAETAQDVIESASRPAVWTKFEASGDVNVPEIGHQEALTVAEVWDGKNVDSFRLALIAPGSKLPNEQWKGGGWYVFGGTREAIATRVAEMAKEQSDLKGKEVKAYYVGNDEAPTGLTKEASMAAAVATAQDNAPVTIERAAATLPVSLPEAKAVVNEFVSVDGKLPVDVVQVNTVAYSMTLNQGETYVVISGKIASKELNTELPQKPGRSHMLVLQGAGQQVSFTNVEAGHMWV